MPKSSKPSYKPKNVGRSLFGAICHFVKRLVGRKPTEALPIPFTQTSKPAPLKKDEPSQPKPKEPCTKGSCKCPYFYAVFTTPEFQGDNDVERAFYGDLLNLDNKKVGSYEFVISKKDLLIDIPVRCFTMNLLDVASTSALTMVLRVDGPRMEVVYESSFFGSISSAGVQVQEKYVQDMNMVSVFVACCQTHWIEPVPVHQLCDLSKATECVEIEPVDQEGDVIRITQEAFRRSMSLLVPCKEMPGHWQSRFNYDVIARMFDFINGGFVDPDAGMADLQAACCTDFDAYTNYCEYAVARKVLFHNHGAQELLNVVDDMDCPALKHTCQELVGHHRMEPLPEDGSSPLEPVGKVHTFGYLVRVVPITN